jgi:hypothetical protein
MLAKAQSQLSENGAKYDEWQGKLSKVASEIDQSRRIISQEVGPLVAQHDPLLISIHPSLE